MGPHELYEREIISLREELHSLKNCQLSFLTFSVTATGVILGFGSTLASGSAVGIVPLFPLTVLLPGWWIFFDKATTITRIVGYYRILEGLILRRCEAANFIGWENALGEFRRKSANGALALDGQLSNPPFRELVRIFSLRTSHRYWVIAYYTFLALSGLCVAASVAILSQRGAWLLVTFAPAVLLLASVLWNAWVVWQLIDGYCSYDSNERSWRLVLQVKSGEEKEPVRQP